MTTITFRTGPASAKPLNSHKKPLTDEESILTPEGRVKSYDQLTASQQMALDVFVQGHVQCGSPIGRQIGAELLQPHLQSVLKKTMKLPADSPFQREDYNTKIQLIRRLIKSRAESTLIQRIKLHLGHLGHRSGSMLVKFNPEEELYSRLLHGKASIPMRINQQLTLNQALRTNHPLVFNRALQAINRYSSAEEKTILNQTDPLGLTAFHTAILTRHLPEALALLQEGADPFIMDTDGNMALKTLAEFGQAEQLDKLLKHTDSKLKATHARNIESLQREANANQAAVKVLARNYQSLSAENKRNHLSYLVSRESQDVQMQWNRLLHIQALIQAGTDIHSLDEIGETPLFRAARFGQDRTVQLLAQAGAQIDCSDSNSYMPLLWASHVGDVKTVKTLIRIGSNVNQVNKNGSTPLHHAARAGHSSIVQLLAQAGADVNQANHDGLTPLQDAISSGHAQTVNVLLQSGAKFTSLVKAAPAHFTRQP